MRSTELPVLKCKAKHSMRTHERFIKRIVIPVLAVGLIALLINFIVREKIADDPPEPEGIEQSALVQIPREERELPEFTPQLVDHEIAALRRAVAGLDTFLSERANAEGGAPSEAELQTQKEQARNKIDALSQATEENWDQLRREAYDAVQDYARAAGVEVETTPQAGAGTQ